MKIDHIGFVAVVVAAVILFALVLPTYNSTIGTSFPALKA